MAYVPTHVVHPITSPSLCALVASETAFVGIISYDTELRPAAVCAAAVAPIGHPWPLVAPQLGQLRTARDDAREKLRVGFVFVVDANHPAIAAFLAGVPPDDVGAVYIPPGGAAGLSVRAVRVLVGQAYPPRAAVVAAWAKYGNHPTSLMTDQLISASALKLSRKAIKTFVKEQPILGGALTITSVVKVHVLATAAVVMP